MSDKPERMTLKEGLKFTITAAITDAAVFNHYVLKEYAPRVQGSLAMSKNPAKHTLENCLYDEIAGWLDMPTVTGLSILNIEAESSAFKNTIIKQEPRISFSAIVDLLYNISKLSSTCKANSSICSVDAQQLQELKDKAKWILQHVDKVVVDGDAPEKRSIPKVGSGVLEGAVSGRLPKTP